VKQEIKVPSVGESVTQGVLSAWLKAEGAWVEEGSDLFELETDKATVTVPAPASGALSITVAAGAEVKIGAAVGFLDAAAARPAAARPAAAPAGTPAARTSPAAATLSPAVRRVVEERGLSASAITGTGPGGRITKEDALDAPAGSASAAPAAPRPAAPPAPAAPAAEDRRVPLSTIRRRIAERLVEAQRNTAYLTTFNEVDMERVSALRTRYREDFERIHGVRLGFLSFFVRAACIALREHPDVNARIEGDEIVYNGSCHVGVAVSTERGLLVPVVRSAETLSLAGLEAAVADLAARARDRKIMPDELAGGTFSITNGGVFGSLLSTPLPSYPQTAILGMHAIQRRPVAVGEEVVIRPMMYVALTYDHRLIDGREAVGFLKRIKELVEDPERQLLEV
jgi:2-oxoglutarate dehydrogenase E2 component (dihydrolipoamide succinyltransferase)